MRSLTDQQQAIRDFIEREVAAGRPCPSQREIAGHFGFASKTAAAKSTATRTTKPSAASASGSSDE